MRHEVQVDLLKTLMSQLDRGVNADAGGLRKNPASAYTSAERADQEWETFFKGHPQFIGLSGDLPEPNSFLTVDDFGVAVLATRDKDGKFRAFLNACRHRGVMVEPERRGTKKLFSCPFHSWTYSAGGDLVGIPMEDHFGNIDKTCHGLIELPTLEKLGCLFVHPDPKGVIDADALMQGIDEDFETWKFGDLVNGGEVEYDMALNWKLATDTFGETYHFKRLHKDTLAQVFYGDVLAYDHYERNHRMILCIREIDNLRNKPESEWSITTGGFPVYFLFPNTIFNVGPSGVTVVRAMPVPGEPGRHVSKISFYFKEEALAAEPELLKMRAEAFGNVVESEDYATAVTTQKAAESGLMEYVIFGRNEPPLHHYHNTFRKALGMEPLELLQEV
jgi:phenylpropionate dioxygenase-like ring-hydroxylating dioxygenase large terminal subunit